MNYFYWDGNELIAIDPNNLNRYTSLKSNGIYTKGTLTAEREDGLKTIIGGKLNVDFSIQGSTPSFTVDASIAGRYFTTTKLASEGGAQCDLYTFKRVSRYLKLELALATEPSGYTAYASVVESGTTTVLGSTSSTESVGSETIKTVTVDLGPPDGETFAIRLRMSTNNASKPAYCRVNRIYQTDY